MVTLIFSLFDKKAGFYSAPMTFRAEGEALRACTERANDPTHPMGQFPEDYTLYQLGAFDDQSAELNLTPKPVFKTEIVDLKRKFANPTELRN